jgi:hypothetical protein
MKAMTTEQLVRFAEENGITVEQAEALVTRMFKREEYNRKPEVVAKRQEYRKAYNQKPEVKAKRAAAYELQKAFRQFAASAADESDE